MPTHGHGQGYTDLNFLIPELVGYLDYSLAYITPSWAISGALGARSFISYTPWTAHLPVRGRGQMGWRGSLRADLLSLDRMSC